MNSPTNIPQTPNTVFTPRSADVNEQMYIRRTRHEKSLIRWLRENMHGFIFGESGSGKTWLYKNIFHEHQVNYKIANCTLAASKGSLRKEIYSVCVPEGSAIKTGFVEKKEAGVEAFFAKGSLSHEGQYEVLTEDTLLASFESLSSTAKGWGNSIIVLDNVETIFDNKELMDELADIIILLDDERYSKHNVKFLLVGVPCGVIEYFSKSKNRSSVGNRIKELPALSGFTLEETSQIIDKGLNELLQLNLSELVTKGIGGQVYDRTLGLPQRVHEYCLNLCYESEDHDWKFNKEVFDSTELMWLSEGLRESYAVLEEHYSSTQIRKKQVLYTIGKLKGHQFTIHEVGQKLRSEFPLHGADSDAGIGSILSTLSIGDSPLLTRSKSKDQYSFCDPRHIMCLRIFLDKDNEETVTRKVFIRN